MDLAWLPVARHAHYPGLTQDRKSTRLNSSHSQISYAVFCLKKKRSRSTPLRLSTAAGDSVCTTIPSAPLVAQAGTSFACPSTETRQMRQLPTLGRLGYQQRV